MQSSTRTRTGATLALLTLLALGLAVGPTPVVGQAADGGPSFEFDDEPSADFGLVGGDGSPAIGGSGDGNDSGPAFDFGSAGDEPGQQAVALTVGGAARDSRQVDLAAGERRTGTRSWDTAASDAGTYTATVDTANDTGTASLTVENVSDGGDGDDGSDGDAVLPFRPSSFDASVQGETAYLHSGVNNGSFPIEFTECEDFQPTQVAREANPDYLPLDECIGLNGTVDEETDTWTGELNFPRITGAIPDTRPIGDVYYAAEIVTTEPVTGTFDLSTGEITGETLGVDVDRESNYELGLPAGPGENELVLDFALDLER